MAKRVAAIGHSRNTRPKNRGRRRNFKAYKGRGKTV